MMCKESLPSQEWRGGDKMVSHIVILDPTNEHSKKFSHLHTLAAVFKLFLDQNSMYRLQLVWDHPFVY